MAVSHSKKGVCHLSTACHGWDHFISFTQGGFNEKRNSILSCMLFKGEKIFKIILKKGICMESYCSRSLSTAQHGLSRV